MLLIDVHQLDIVLAEPVGLLALKHQVDHVGRILGLEREDVVVLRRAEHLGERAQVDAQRQVAVAAVWREALGFEDHRHERHVRVVHGLKGDAGVVAVEVAVLHELSDGLDYLLGDVSERLMGRIASLFLPSSADWPARVLLPTL